MEVKFKFILLIFFKYRMYMKYLKNIDAPIYRDVVVSRSCMEIPQHCMVQIFILFVHLFSFYFLVNPKSIYRYAYLVAIYRSISYCRPCIATPIVSPHSCQHTHPE